MPRKDDIRKDYHSRNERSRGGYSQSSSDAVLHNPITNWWDDNWHSAENAWNGDMQSERDYWMQSFLLGIPGVSGAVQANWNKNALDHYMKQYGLSWSDLKSRNIFGGQFSNAAAVKNTTNFVSDIIKELYS